MASLARKSISRTYFSLPVSVRTDVKGIPAVPGLNLRATGAHEDHDEPVTGKWRSDVNMPSWSARSSVGPLGVMLRGPVNVAPTVPGRRFISTSSPSEAAASVASTPKYEPKSVTRDEDYVTPAVPYYSKYTSKATEAGTKNFSYFVVGTMGLLTAAGAKSSVSDFIASLSASADVLALAKVEVDLASIPEGKNVIIKWRGKPVFVRHRTAADIKDAESVDVKALRDPQADKERVKKPEWLVMLGVCTHLGCVPIGEAGDYNGWFCPCHGSHYDSSGRIRKGPAPLNLEVPEYDFPEDGKMIIG